MKKYEIAFVLILFAAPCLAGPKKQDPAKFMPPAQSHGQTITGYGCDKSTAGASTTESGGSYWSLIVWAQYGKEHKRYWQKTYNTYQVPVKHAVGSSGESAGSGGAIGAYGTESYDFSSMDKACADWGALVNSTLKVKPD
ncbi:MAG TPA: hypothetical protein VE077_19130, partial [Candidatus Methylomirabilis sp.]|nr:hypothetical protein [Candidatus Methylomirabilis sp.]